MPNQPGPKPTAPPTVALDLRKAAGLTQAAAAAILDVSLSTWQKWEQGKRLMHRRHVAVFRERIGL